MLAYIRNRYHPLWRLRKNRLYRAFQSRFDPDATCRIGKVRASVKLLRDAGVILPQSDLECASRKAFIELIEEERIELFFDVGANIGLYSWTALQHGVNEIFLFEPDKTNQRLLSKTIRRNHLAQCHLMPFAVSNEIGVAEFLIDQASGATGSLENHTANDSSLHSAYGLQQRMRTPTITLDTFADYAANKRTMLKIDVEGAEQKVLDGAHVFLEKARPIILIECYQTDVLDYCRHLGYRMVDLKENENYLLLPE